MKEYKLADLFYRIEDISWIRGIRGGLVMSIPVLLMGSFSLILKTFLEGSAGNSWLGALHSLASVIYDGTFGILSLVIATFICFHCLQQKGEDFYIYGGPLTALAGIVILNGGLKAGIDSGSFGVKGMFTATFCALLTSAVYYRLSIFFRKKHFFGSSGDFMFQSVLNSLLPSAGTILLFALINEFITLTLGRNSFQDMVLHFSRGLSCHLERNLPSGILFVILSGILWFFGIHGNDILDNMTQNLFTPAIEINSSLLAAGQEPTEIFSKTFLDVFVFMGGCGSLMALFIAILFFSKNTGSRNLAKAAAFPMLFNINEIMVFGLPIVMNPIFILPFLLTPIVCLLTSFLAMSAGLAAVPVSPVEWPTPVLISGYLATGSVSGIFLQLFNLVLGVIIYRPFVRIYDRRQITNASRQIQQLTDCLKASEQTGRPIFLTRQKDNISLSARHLAMDLKHHLEKGILKMYYQPQFDEKDRCVGAEALIRWNHPSFGMIYPPLMIQLAKETDILTSLEKYVFTYVKNDLGQLVRILGAHIKISVNVTPETLRDDNFLTFLKELSASAKPGDSKLCIEVTEQTDLGMDEDMLKRLQMVKDLGFLLAIDDFSMGSTSLKYLKNNCFDMIKLDGSLVRNLQTDENASDIVTSILSLSQALGLSVLAEYTENRQVQKQLEQLGCTLYQGYLYSPAVPISELGKAVGSFSEAEMPGKSPS